MAPEIRHIGLSYDNSNSRESALRLILTLFPEWTSSQDTIEFLQFKDGITNTLLKAVNRRPGLSEDDIDREAVLLRAYGNGSAVLIDRDCECDSHALLASFKLAPPLLARFENGLLYRFIQGNVTSPADLRRPEIWRGVARRLAEWHVKIPLSALFDGKRTGDDREQGAKFAQSKVADVPSPNVWTVTRRWVEALSTETDAERRRKVELQAELEWLANEIGDVPGINNQSLVFSHCDLLSGNVIIQPQSATETSPQSSSASLLTTASTHSAENQTAVVSFIDYEYATPAPAAFDLANHFAEWCGFDCDFSVLPSRAQRRDFLKTYLNSYNALSGREYQEAELEQLFDEVDRYRGAPGFYWGIWGLVQAKISQIDFDYASYAETRLSEYYDWRESLKSSPNGAKDSVRERRWAQEQ